MTTMAFSPKQRSLLRAFKDDNIDFILSATNRTKVSLYDAGLIVPTNEKGNQGGWKLTEIGAHIVKNMRNRSKRHDV